MANEHILDNCPFWHLCNVHIYMGIFKTRIFHLHPNEKPEVSGATSNDHPSENTETEFLKIVSVFSGPFNDQNLVAKCFKRSQHNYKYFCSYHYVIERMQILGISVWLPFPHPEGMISLYQQWATQTNTKDTKNAKVQHKFPIRTKKQYFTNDNVSKLGLAIYLLYNISGNECIKDGRHGSTTFV